MNISKHSKLFFCCFLVFAFVLPLMAPLATAEETDGYICMDGENYRLSVAPYQGEYGMVACAEDLARAFGMRYAFDAEKRSFTLYDDVNGEVVLMHKATRFYSGETVYNCLPYFYVENAVPMIDIGFFCEMFDAQFSYDAQSGNITIEHGAAKTAPAVQPYTLLMAAEAGSGTVSGTISYADGAPEGGLEAELLLSAVIARSELYGYGDTVLSPITLGSTYLAEGATSASYSYDVSAFQGIYDSYILHCVVPELEYTGYANTLGSVTETEYSDMTLYSDANCFAFDAESIADFPIVKGKIEFAYDGTTLTISGSGDLIAVPDEYSDAVYVVIEEGVTSVGAGAFYQWGNLQNIMLPDGIRSIGDDAFGRCYSLTDIELPDSVQCIGERAFDGCHLLKSICIPDGVQSIGRRTFRGCGLVSVTIPDSVQSIEDQAFYNCYNLETVVIPDSVKIIGDNAFASCYSLRTVDLSDSVEYIGNYAFYSCNALTSIALPASLTSVGYLMFGLCHSLTSITVDEKNPAFVSDSYGALYDRDMTTLLQYPAGNSCLEYTVPDGIKGIGDYAFYYADSLKMINLPDSITYIGDRAFYKCSRLTSICIPDGVTSIGNYTFYSCRALQKVTIPESVTHIGSGAFYYCESLTAVSIPAGVTYIGSQAFARCTSLVSIPVDANNLYYANDTAGALYNKGKTDLIQYPAGSSCTEYAVASGVRSIRNYAFYGCDKLTGITLPDGVKSIGSFAFSKCSRLKSIEIPDSVTSIGYSAFSDCSSLKSIYIPDGVTGINDSTFCGCSDLESITIPFGVEYIGYDAFYGCNDLESIVIPNSVTEIGGYAFAECYSLTSVRIGRRIEYIDYGAFRNCHALESIVIPDSVTEIGEEAFANCYALANVTLGSGLKYIGNWAFYNCEDLTEIYIPDSVETVAADAFEGCDDLVIYRYGAADKMIRMLGIRIPDDDLALSDTPYKYQIAVLLAQTITGKTDLAMWNAEQTSTYFTDVVAYGTAIDYLVGLGIIPETDSDIFGYTDTVMYQDMIAYAVRTLGYESADMQYPYGHILAAQKLELLDGIDIVNYKQVVTVGETMQLFWNMLNTEVAVIDPMTEKILYPGEVGMTETTTGTVLERNILLEKAGFVIPVTETYYIVTPDVCYEIETTENEDEYKITFTDLFDLKVLRISEPVVWVGEKAEMQAVLKMLISGNLVMLDTAGNFTDVTESITIEQALLELHEGEDSFLAAVTAFEDGGSITVMDGKTEVVNTSQTLNSINITVGLLDQTGFDWEYADLLQDEMYTVGVPYTEGTYAGVNSVQIGDAAYYNYTVDFTKPFCAVATPTPGVYSQLELDAAAKGWAIKAADADGEEYCFTTDLYTVASFDAANGNMTLKVLKVLTAVPQIVDSIEVTVTEFIEADEDDEESCDTVEIDYTYALADGTQIHEIGVQIAAADLGITADTPKISYLGLPVTVYIGCEAEDFRTLYEQGTASIAAAYFAEYTEVENLGDSGNIKVVASSVSDENTYIEFAGEKFANSAYEISLKVWDAGWTVAEAQMMHNFLASFCYDTELGYLGEDAANPFAAYATEMNSYGKVAYRVISVDGGKDILEILYTPYTFGLYIERDFKYTPTGVVETFKIIGNYTGTEFATVDGETTWFEERFLGSNTLVNAGLKAVSKTRGEASLEAIVDGEISSGDFMFYHYNGVDNILTVVQNCGTLRTGKMTAVNQTKEAVKISGTNYPVGFAGVYPACSVYDYDRIWAIIMSLTAGQENVQYLTVDGNVVFYTEYGSSLPKEYDFAVISTDAEIMADLLGITELKYQQSLAGAFDGFAGHYVDNGYVVAAFLNPETGEWELGNILDVATTYADGEFGDFCDVATMAGYYDLVGTGLVDAEKYMAASLTLAKGLLCVAESADGVYTLADVDTVDEDGVYLIDRLENTDGLIFDSVGVTNAISASDSVDAARVYTNESTVIAAIGAGGIEVRRGQQSGAKSIEGTVTFFAADAVLIVLTTDADISGWGDRAETDVKYYVTTPNTGVEIATTEDEDEYEIIFTDLFDLEALCISEPVEWIGEKDEILALARIFARGNLLMQDTDGTLNYVTDKTVAQALLELGEYDDAFTATVTEFKDDTSITVMAGDTEIVNASQAVSSINIEVGVLDLTEIYWEEVGMMYVAGVPYAEGVYNTSFVKINDAKYYSYELDMESPLGINEPVIGMYSQFEIDAAANGWLIKAVDEDDAEYLFTTEIHTVASFDTTTGDMTLTVLKVLIPVEEHACVFGDWIVRVAATATSAGEKYRVCSICGATEVQTIPVAQQGDIDGDGEIDISDSLVVLKAVLNKEDIENADMNGDGRVSLLDVLQMLKLSTQ